MSWTVCCGSPQSAEDDDEEVVQETPPEASRVPCESEEAGLDADPVAERLANNGFTVRQLLEFYREKIQRPSEDLQSRLQRQVKEGRFVASKLLQHYETNKDFCEADRAYGERPQGELLITTSDIVREIVIPETEAKASSYMESDFMQQHGGPRQATKLVSHAWKSSFLGTVLNILSDALEGTDNLFKKHVARHREGSRITSLDAETMLSVIGPEVLDMTYWLCAFAINEHQAICGTCWTCQPRTPEELRRYECKCGPKFNPCPCGSPKLQSDDAGYELDKFDKVVRRMPGGLVVSLDPDLETLRRIWVLSEIDEAMQQKLVRILFARGLADEAMSKLRNKQDVVPRAEDCEASSEEDRARILRQICDHGGYKLFDDFVSCMVEIGFGVCHKLGNPDLSDGLLSTQRLLNMDLSWNRSLASTGEMGMDLLWKLSCLTSLSVSFEGLEELLDVEALGRGIANLERLTTLTLSFSDCQALSDIKAVGDGLSKLVNLESLSLNLSRCFELSDIKAVGDGLSKLVNLESLRLNVQYCHELSDIKALGRGIGNLRGLTTFTLSFADCQALSDVEAVGDGLSELANLATLKLDFRGCKELSDIKALGRGIGNLQGLTTFTLSFADCQALSDVEAVGDGLSELTNLATLNLDLRGCKEVSDIKALGRGIGKLQALTTLTLSFADCQALSDVEALGRGIGNLQGLTSFTLSFGGCLALSDVKAVGDGISNLTNLESLSLNFFQCVELSDIKAVGDGIPSLTNLATLTLNFFNCFELSDIKAIGDGIAGCASLTSLILDFRFCSSLSDVKAIGDGIAKCSSLTSLNLDFRGCKLLSDVKAIGDGIAKCSSLTSLSLDFRFCKSLSDVQALAAGVGNLKNPETFCVNLNSSGVPQHLQEAWESADLFASAPGDP